MTSKKNVPFELLSGIRHVAMLAKASSLIYPVLKAHILDLSFRMPTYLVHLCSRALIGSLLKMMKENIIHCSRMLNGAELNYSPIET